jgi:predicted PurR-regulated permease PerM
MIQAYYSTEQIFYTVALSGILTLAFWKPIHAIGSIFHCLPGRIHASMVFGIVLIVLSRVNAYKLSFFHSQLKTFQHFLL